MSSREIFERISLEEKHFSWTSIDAPRVEPGGRHTLGRRLFELYQKYEVSSEDQREIESLVWVLQSTIASNTPKPWWKRWI